MKMDVNDDWQLEMHLLMEVFERESILSLRKINHCFITLNRPFDEDFRQYYLKMSTLRLDSGFNTILFEQLAKSRAKPPSTASAPNIFDETANGSNYLSSDIRKGGPQNKSSEPKSNIGATIEITDSDGDSVAEHVESREANDAIFIHQESNASEATEEANRNSDGENYGTSMTDENDGEAPVKYEFKAEIDEVLVDLPMEVFDPNKENESSSAEDGASVPESIDGQSQVSASASGQNVAEQTDGKRFKCKRCAYTTNRKGHFQSHRLIHKTFKTFKCENCDYASKYIQHVRRHQRVHVQQKLQGVSQDSNDGRYKCTHCDQRFTKWNGLKYHLTMSHKNNQRLFNCGRCMRRFTQETKKERHGARCQSHRHECYLCKTYVTRQLTHMKKHLRTHTGAKPFECT